MKRAHGDTERISANISFVGDLPHEMQEDAFTVSSDADYIAACARIGRPLGDTPSAEIMVRNRSHFTWLKNFAEQTGVHTSFIEKTARDVLAERWKVRIPDWLSDTEILNQKLLSVEAEPAGDLPFEQVLLAKFLGPAFKNAVLNAENLGFVVAALASAEADALFARFPVLKRCLKETCERWAGRSGDKWIGPLCERLITDPKDLLNWLGMWSCLYGYPDQALDFLLPPVQAMLVRSIPPAAVRDVSFDRETRENVLEQIRFILDDVRPQITSREDLKKVIDWMSGKLVEEFRFIETVLKSEKIAPEKADITEIRKKFESCPGLSRGRLDTLEYFLKPNKPRSVAEGAKWDPSEWVAWSVEEYMPYRAWQIRSGSFDSEVEESVKQFSDWYFDEFAAVQGNVEWGLLHCLEPRAQKPEELSVVLLADCLPVEFLSGVDNLLRTAGFRRVQIGYRFASLPTTTEYNKQALLGGDWEIREGGYTATLKARSRSDWGERPVYYTSSVKDFSEMEIPDGPAVVVFNFLDGDEILHTDVEAKGSTYDEELYRLYSRVADALQRIAETRQGQKNSVGLYLVTDHGACRILEEEMKVFESSVVSRLFPDEKYRCACIQRSEESKIPQNLWDLGYRFVHPFTPAETVFFLPKGHNTVRKPVKSRGYMHGGATPEEVVVPIAFYSLMSREWKVPAARFLNLGKLTPEGRAIFYIRWLVSLEVEIQNPNTLPVAVTGAEIPTPEGEVKSFEGLVIPAGGTGTVRAYCSFGKSALEEKSLEVRLLYEIEGEKRSGSVRIACEFKSAVTGGFNLKDLT